MKEYNPNAALENKITTLKKTYFILLLGLFALFSCRKEKTNWNSDWVLPLVNDTLSLENSVNDSTLSEGAGTFYQVDLSRTILDLGIEDLIQIPDTSIVHTYNSVVASLSVPPGFNVVNEIEEHAIDLNEIQLKKIRVSKGTINMKVYNPVATKTLFTIELPGVTKNGVVFQQNYEAPAGTSAYPGTETAVLDISGYDLDLTGVSGGEYNVLQSRLNIKTDPNGPTILLLSNQIFKVEADFKNIKIDYARGYFGNVSVSDTSEYTIELLNSVTAGSVDLPAMALQFEISNGMKVTAKATITKVENTNNSGNTVQLSNAQIGAPIYLNAATGSWTNITNSMEIIEFTSANSSVETYLENLGKTHTLGYKIELNPWGNTSGGWNEIFPNSRLKVKLKAQLPLAIGADGLTLRDTFDFDVAQNLNKSHVESGKIILNASNAFPISSAVKLVLLNENSEVLYTVPGTNQIVSSLMGSIDPNDGMLKKNSEVEFVLTEAIVANLDVIKKVIVETQFNTPDASGAFNQQVSIPVGAFLAVKLKTKFNLKTIL